MKYKILLGIFLLSVLITTISAAQVCEIYDDFSSQTLNTDKWEELIGKSTAEDWLDEHYIDTTNQNYHTSQLSQADRGVELKALHTFQAGETLEFDLIYNYGSGNHWGCAFWDETSSWNYGLTCIGHWNEINANNGNYGTYHYKAEFQNNGINITRTLPDLSVENWFYSNIETPYTFSVVSKTGHNGLLHFDYDNFKICTEEQEPPEVDYYTKEEVDEKLSELEQKVEELENRTSLLESIIDKIVEFIKGLPRGLRKHWE